MKFQSLEQALVNRGYLSSERIESIKKKTGTQAEGLLPHLVREGVLTPAEAACYAYGCEEYPSESSLLHTLRKQGWSPDQLRDVFRRFVLHGRHTWRTFEEFLHQEGLLAAKEVLRGEGQASVGSDLAPPASALSDVPPPASPAEESPGEVCGTGDLGGEEEENITLEKLSESSDSIVTLLNQIVYQAIEDRASDIHFEPQESAIQVRFRVDGVLYPVRSLDRRLHQPLCGRVKVISALDTTQKRTPQDGRFKLRINGRRVDFRVSIIPCIFGESVVIRILDKMIRDLDLTNLGFDEREFSIFQREIRNPYGMILVSGPTGSGKTTTLYSAITMIKTPRVEIITIEDPVEYIIPGILQIAVNDRQGLTFSTGLRSIVRHDPDIIMVGEIRDAETAQVAVQASLTGHLVFSTIHCNNTVDIISRFANMAIAPYEFAAAVNLLISQRLVRCLCQRCSSAASLAIGAARRQDCPHCHGRGFWGRTGIFEVLPMTESIKTLILEQATPFQITKEARTQGMVPLREAGLRKVRQGITTLEEVDAVTMSQL